MINYNIFSVRNDDGSINVELTVKKFVDGLLKYKASTDLDYDRIINATLTIFERNNKKIIPRDVLITSVANLLNVDVDQMKNFSQRLIFIFKNETIKYKSSSGKDGLFCLKPGKNGGVILNK